MLRRLFQIFLIFLMLIINCQVEGQSLRVPAGVAGYKFFQIPGRIKLDKGDPAGAVVNLINLDSKQIEKSITVPSSGKFDLDLSFFKEYKISIIKNGYYDKNINVSTVIPLNVWEKDSIFPPFYIVVTLYKKVDSVKFSFEGKTIGKVSYSPSGTLDNFDSNIFINDQDIQEEINNALKNIEDKDFNQKMADALEYEKRKDLSTAYRLYNEASKIKPSDKFVKEKLKELASELKNLGNEAKIQAEYDRLIALGDANVNSFKYNDAIQYYKGALKVKPNDPFAVSKLADAEKQLALAGDKAKKDAEFTRLIAAGDANVSQTKYADAISNFKEALTIRPGDSIALARIADAEKQLALAGDKAKKDAEFTRLIAAGDANVSQTKYADAISNFKEALIIRPGDSIALARIADAEKQLALAGAKAKKDAEFTRLIAAGDANVSQTKYADAISNFKEALTIRPGDSIALARIADAEKQLALAGDKAKKDAEFTRLIAAGDANVSQTKYADAISNFKEALIIRPGDSIALARIADAEKQLALAGDKAKKDAEFTRLVLKGDDNVTEKKYNEAINNYKSALGIKINNQEVIVKLNNATRLLALVNEAQNKLEQEFNRLLTSGDASVSAKNFAEALSFYKSALVLKNNEVVNTKITETERLMQLAEIERTRLEAEKQAIALKQQKYKEAIDKADQLFASKSFPESKQFYQQALAVDQAATYPGEKIREIDKIVAQLQADAFAREQESAKIKLYSDVIKLADENFKAKNWNLSLTNYTKASDIRPNEVYPKNKIQEVKNFITQENAISKLYNDAMLSGGAYFDAKRYSDAISAYREAQKIKPSEILPAQKIKEIQSIIDALATKTLDDQKSAANQKLSSDEKIYLEKIKIADENFLKSQWPVARFYYIEASKFKQGDNYSLEKVDACDKMIDSGITAEKMQEYKNKTDKADEEMKAKNYSSARFYYRSASDILKWETYPQQQLKELDRMVAEKLNASDQRLFTENLNKADDAFNHKEYPVARFYYNKAIEISQSDQVVSRLKEIESIVNGSEAKKINASFDDCIKKGDEAVKQKNSSIARFYFQKASALKPNENYPKEELRKIDVGAVNP